MPSLTSIVDQGIVYEDQFVEMYLKMLRDEGFMEVFGANAEEAKKLITIMIDESIKHRADLELLKAKLG